MMTSAGGPVVRPSRSGPARWGRSAWPPGRQLESLRKEQNDKDEWVRAEDVVMQTHVDS